MLMTIRKNHIIGFVVNYEAVLQHYTGTPKETDAFAQEVVEFLMDAIPSTVFTRVAEIMLDKENEFHQLQKEASEK